MSVSEPRKENLVPKFVNFRADQVAWFEERGLAISTIVREITDWFIEDVSVGRVNIEVGKIEKDRTK
jgi:hypothetical protein